MDDFDALIKIKRIYYLFSVYNRLDDSDISDLEALLSESSADLEKEFAGYARDINNELDNYDETSQMGEVIVSYNYYPLEVSSFEKIGLAVEDISIIGIRD
ncbi:MAG: hypothetical protein ACXAEU_02695 [Candidatus Hodarchaeales archaeon]